MLAAIVSLVRRTLFYKKTKKTKQNKTEGDKMLELKFSQFEFGLYDAGNKLPELPMSHHLHCSSKVLFCFMCPILRLVPAKITCDLLSIYTQVVTLRVTSPQHNPIVCRSHLLHAVSHSTPLKKQVSANCMRARAHNPLATDAGDNTVMDYHLIRRGVAVVPVESYYKTSYISPPPFAKGFLEERPHQTKQHTQKTTQDVRDMNGKGIAVLPRRAKKETTKSKILQILQLQCSHRDQIGRQTPRLLEFKCRPLTQKVSFLNNTLCILN